MVAHISLLIKEGKDPSLCPSYRPISLINEDIKIYAKILAERLRAFLPLWIDGDQVGFVPGREARDNVIKTNLLIHGARLKKIPFLCLSVDAEKAFDRLDWDFMLYTLRRLGLGPRMLEWIGALYSCPTAQVRVNGSLSGPIEIKNGTRQGCPLSPLLFVIALEPLLINIRAKSEIRGLKLAGQEYKLAAFADDILIYLTEPAITFPKVLEELERYGKISNFKINTDKSEILNVSVSTAECRDLRLKYPFIYNQVIPNL